jgi:hypothetical protein
MKKAWTVVKGLLIVWGLVSLVALIAVCAVIAYRTGPGNSDSVDSATKQDVRFVLNWCRLGDDRIDTVVHSYESARSFTGDHLDAYAIKISHVDVDELVPDEFGAGWYRCDDLDGVLKDAVEFAAGWLNDDEIEWFLTEDELRSDAVYVYPWSIYCHGTQPSAVELIFVRPEDRMVFYMGCKM